MPDLTNRHAAVMATQQPDDACVRCWHLVTEHDDLGCHVPDCWCTTVRALLDREDGS